MDYRDLTWSDLRAFASSQGINTIKKKKVTILNELDNILPFIVYKEISDNYLLNEVVEFKGIKETHPIFEEAVEFIPYLRVFNTKRIISSNNEISKGIAVLFMKYIEEHKGAALNLSCGRCKPAYYERFVAGYNRLAEEYGRECI